LKTVTILGPAHPLRGGIAGFNERLAVAFQAAGWQAKIYTFSLQYPKLLFPGKTQRTDAPKPEGLDIEVSINSINPLNWWALGRRIRKERPDLLVPAFWLPFMAPSLGTIAGMARKNGRTKAVALVHNMIPHEHRPGDGPFSRYFVKRMDGFVALSQSVVDDIARFDAAKPRTWGPHPMYDHYGPKVDRTEACAALGLDPQYRYILFFGFIRQYKGLDLLLEAMKELEGQPNVRLIVAGEFYEDESNYRPLLEALGDRVVAHTGFIPEDRVRHYFSAADLVVQPYRSATQSGVAQIAYYYEVPMVVTNVGGLPEIVPDGRAGYVVEPDPKAIAEGIQRYFALPDKGPLLEALRAEKARFTWDKMVEAFVRVARLD
jgi:D-inositol-3-phosphate glycosyltransferase